MIVEWENGSTDEELTEVSHEQAGRIVEYFRRKFAEEAAGQSGAGMTGEP